MRGKIFISVFIGVLGAIAAGFAIYVHSYTNFEKAYADSRKLQATLETLKMKELELAKKDNTITQLNDELKKYKESHGNIAKLQEEIINKDTEINEAKLRYNKLNKSTLQLQKELQNCRSGKNQITLQSPKEQSYTRDPSKKYTHNMENVHTRLRNTSWAFLHDICISIEEVKHNKIYGFVGSKEFPSLRMNGVEIGQKLEYRTNFFYEIKPTQIGMPFSGDVDFFLIQYKEMKD